MFDLIKELTELPGPVGQEEVVLAHMEALWRAEGATVSRTRIGNVVAHAGGQGPRVLMIAHGDEPAFWSGPSTSLGFFGWPTAKAGSATPGCATVSRSASGSKCSRAKGMCLGSSPLPLATSLRSPCTNPRNSPGTTSGWTPG